MAVLDLKVGYACNNRCLHCVIADQKERLRADGKPWNLKTEEVLSVVERARTNGVDSVTHTGGEVSIREDYAIILKQLMEWKMHLTVQTNGRQAARPDVLKLIGSYPHIHFTIALHGATAEVHDGVTQSASSFEETLRSIDALVRLGKHITIKVVISHRNRSELIEIMQLAVDHGVRHLCYAFPHGMGDALANFQEIIPSYTQLLPAVEELAQAARRQSLILDLEAFPLCVVGGYCEHVAELRDSPDTDVRYLQVGGELREWNEDRRSIKAKFTQCTDCILDDMCEGPWNEYPVIYGESEFRPVSFSPKAIEEFVVKIAQARMQDKCSNVDGSVPGSSVCNTRQPLN